MSAPDPAKRNGSSEKVTRLEASHQGLLVSFEEFRSEVRGQLTRISESLASSSRTDWRTFVGIVAVVMTLIFGVGGAAVAWVSSNVSQLDVVLQREMRLLDQDTHSRLVSLREYATRLDSELESRKSHILDVQILKAGRSAIVDRLTKVESDLISWRRWSRDDHERTVAPVLDRMESRLDEIESALAVLQAFRERVVDVEDGK